VLEELWAEEGKFDDLRRWAVSVPGVRRGRVRWNGWATPIASALRVVLQSWEGEDGHASVGKGGGRWESAAQEKKKKYIQVFCLQVGTRAFAA
jgi:hypothetical protein